MATVTNFANAFETTLTADMLGTDLTAQVQTTDGAPASPCYLVIDPHNDDKREYALFDGTFGANSFVTTVLANRYLDGSAAASGITHAAGAIVRFAPVAQHFQNIQNSAVWLDEAQTVTGAKTFSVDPTLADGSSALSLTEGNAAYVTVEEAPLNPNRAPYNADDTGASNAATGMQAALDAAQQVPGGKVLLRRGSKYRLDSALEIYNPVVFGGEGIPARKWNTSNGHPQLIWNGAATSSPIIVGGTASSNLVESTFNAVEGVRIHDLLIKPTTAGGGREAILIDGSNTINANRGYARDIVIKDVDMVGFGNGAARLLGNVFHARLWRCGMWPNAGRPLFTQEATVNIGLNKPGQIFLYDCFQWVPAVGAQSDLTNVLVLGGHIQGNDGVILRGGCKIDDVHMEGETGSAGAIGATLLGVRNSLEPWLLVNFETGIKIGDGTAAAVVAHRIITPVLQDMTTGVQITAGGARQFALSVGQYTNVTTKIDDLRGSDPDAGIPHEEMLYDRTISMRDASSAVAVSQVGVAGEAYARWQHIASGAQQWLNPTTGAVNANLYADSNRMRTDQRFYAADGVQNRSKAGVFSDADFTTPTDGVVAVDITNHRLYVRSNGVWKYVALT